MKRPLLVYMALCVLLCAAPAAAEDDSPFVQLGDEVINPVVSTALTIPDGTLRIQFTVRDASVHIRMTGADATTTALLLPPNVYKITDPRVLSSIRFINSSDGAATIYVAYFKNR